MWERIKPTKIEFKVILDRQTDKETDVQTDGQEQMYQNLIVSGNENSAY